MKDEVYISGLLGLLASIIVGLGEFYLHYSPAIIGHAENYEFFSYIDRVCLVRGHFIAISGIPLYYLGYYHVYKMITKGQPSLAYSIAGLGFLAFTIGGFWLTSRAFLGTIVHLASDINPTDYQQILDNYTLLSESLVQGLRIIILLLSILFVIAVYRGGTYYYRWMMFFNPIVLLVLIFALYYLLPAVGKYVVPIAMNVAHFIFFGLSLVNYHLHLKTKS